ncbi:MAG: hypothetical protein LBE18_03045 [Planctomycetaceae bacterium]|jgi:predicted ATPase|nr:hypothetical protein [Planctomycetaceae bacterium]
MEFRTNPFSTCNWQAGTIEYIFDTGVDIKKIYEKLLKSGGIGQIIGQHGTGKSALLESLKNFLIKNGLNVNKNVLNSSQKKLSHDFVLSLRKRDTNTFYILDGYEQLTLLSKLKLRFVRYKNTAGFIFTSHRPAPFIPVIYRTIAKPEVFQNLVRNMIKNTNFYITDKKINQIFQETEGNFRNGFFKLYDLFEESEN